MDSGSKIKTSLNVVHSDEIWKDHINRELLAQKHWPQKWGFLSEIYKGLETKHFDEDRLSNEIGRKSTKFPSTDSQMIGWKSATAKQNPYGIPENQARGKCDILRTFNWPQESQ